MKLEPRAAQIKAAINIPNAPERAPETPDAEGRWLACHANGEWREYDVRMTDEGWESRHALSALKWHPVEWFEMNGWGRWQAVAARCTTA